jgi:HTH-type transcriptional regulator / antitoxin MqsA
VRPFKVTYKGKTITVDLPGYYPKGDGDGVHVGNDLSVVDRALHMLKEKVDGIPAAETHCFGVYSCLLGWARA